MVPCILNRAGYGITYLSAIFPACNIGVRSDPKLLAVARDTVNLINGEVGWLSGGGFDMVCDRRRELLCRLGSYFVP